MLKTKRSALSLVLALLLLVTLFGGCAGKPVDSTGSSTTTTAATAASSTSATSDSDTSTTTGVATPENTTTSSVNGGQSGTAAGSTTTSTTKKVTVTTGSAVTKFDVTTAKMPSRDVEKKELVYFSWTKLEDQYGKTAKSLPVLFKKEFGIELTGHFSTHDTYWEDLAKLKAAQESPDLVDLPNWNFYPLPITEELLQPLDSLIDFSNPMWDDTKTIREKNKWNNKTYVPFVSESLQTWFIYNTKMFKDYGIKNTPRELYNKDEWTWDAMHELAKKFVKKDASREVVQWGLTMQTGDLIATTGLELVSGDGKGGYVYNLKDPKVAKLMNLMYDMGVAGDNSLYTGDAITGFKSGKVAMIITNAGTIISDFNEMRVAGKIDWVPMPKMDKDSPYYNQSSFDPGWGIPVGAKNAEGAALFIEYLKWFDLGYQFCSQIPTTKNNAASTKYKLTDKADATKQLTAEEAAWTKSIIAKNYDTVSIMWQSWLGTMVLPGYGTVTSGAKQWSAALEEEFPATNALLQSYVA